MRISISAFILFFFCGLIVFSACDEKQENEPPYPVDGDTCDRTVLVYMLGSNTLGGFVESNISAMKKAVEKGGRTTGICCFISIAIMRCRPLKNYFFGTGR